MRNVSPALGFLTRNSSCTRHYLLVFHIPSEMAKKGIRERYTGLLTLRSIFKDTVHMN